MTTTNWIPETLQPQFIRWATLWHGDCNQYQCGSCEQRFDEPKKGDCPHCGSGNFVQGCIDEEFVECEIANKLKLFNEGGATFQEVFDSVVEVDDEWEESWENYRKYNKI